MIWLAPMTTPTNVPTALIVVTTAWAVAASAPHAPAHVHELVGRIGQREQGRDEQHSARDQDSAHGYSLTR